MKIQCDVCEKEEALVFCSADEAALCGFCDRRVHHANKLASKHQRFALQHPSSNHFPLCDVCQERRAFLFCQQDRAILCRECDVPIHVANEHTRMHDRFLLTGVKLSSSPGVYASSASSVSSISDFKPQPKNKEPGFSSNPAISYAASNAKTTALSTSIDTKVNRGAESQLTIEGGGSTSSISEYLTKTLPGWHVEEFLDSSASIGL